MQLKFYRYFAIDTVRIMSRWLQAETVIEMSRLMKSDKTEDGLKVQLHCEILEESDDKHKPLEYVIENFPQLLKKLLQQKVTLPFLHETAIDQLCAHHGATKCSTKAPRLHERLPLSLSCAINRQAGKNSAPVTEAYWP